MASEGRGDTAAGTSHHPYHQRYYDTYGPVPYDRSQKHWMDFFGTIADRVVADIGPKRVLDVGCAKGFLVETLRDRGVEAFGIDISEYALGEVRTDIRPYCRVARAEDPLDDQYDLIVCVEVVEHMEEAAARLTIANACRAATDVLFSSTPDGFDEPTHVNVRPRSYWIQCFAEQGFFLDLDFDASFIAPHAMRFRKAAADVTLDILLARLERLQSELVALQRSNREKDKRIADMNANLLAIQRTIGWKTLERLRRLRDALLPPDSRRRRGYWAFRRIVEVLLDEGSRAFIDKTGHKLRRLLRGQRLQVGVPEPDIPRDLNLQYEIWLRRHQISAEELARMRDAVARFASTPRVSILTPVYDTDPVWLSRAIESVQAQIYPHWELCLVNDASTAPHVRTILDRYAAEDARIRVEHLAHNEGIAGASAHALAVATGDFVGLLDHDDELAPAALFEVVKRLNEDPALDVLYSDEDKLEADGQRVEPFFKPDWSPDLFLSMNYIAHLSVVRRTLINEAGGFRRGLDGSQDYDLMLRVTERTGRIAHIPKILYHWRKIPGSTAASAAAKTPAHGAARRALEDALHRRGYGGRVESVAPGRMTVRYTLRETPLVSIIVPTRDRWELLQQCLWSVEEKTDYEKYEIIVVDNDSTEPATLGYLDGVAAKWRVCRYPGRFNFSTINNFGVAQARGDYLLFLNNDVQVIRSDWLTALLEHAQRPEVGAVGAKLLYPDDRIQHAGVVLGIGGVAVHAFKYLPHHVPGYYGFSGVVRNYSAVTAACLMVRRQVFDEVGGFDERFRVAFNDVDFCLRLRRRGYLVVYTPLALLYHHESASRGGLHPPEDEELCWKLWGDLIRRGDPYYNPNLSVTRNDWSLRL
ncbi:MAG: glycosyltransferase [Candidatus Rokubacteria bacterium]|nr:glycosyltransferase [Candidatus Rokubacteria bacterium]